MSSAQRWTLTVVCVSTAVLLINVAAPNVALEAIADDLEHAYGAFKGTEAPLRLCDPPGDGRQGGG